MFANHMLSPLRELIFDYLSTFVYCKYLIIKEIKIFIFYNL